MLQKIDNEVINQYQLDGLLMMQSHPTLDLRILNYTAKCQWEKSWDEVTLSARGLVVDGEGNIVARCLKKFFNMSELDESQIPNLLFDVFEKEDGSMIQLFWYKNQWVVSSRGSFTSDHVGWAWEILNEKYQDSLKYLEFLVQTGFNSNLIFELIAPQNRIVRDYGDKKDLILLAVLSNKTGYEYVIHNSPTYCGFTPVKKYNGISDFKSLKDLISDDREGYVVRLANGFRMKIKGDEYCRLHKLMTNINSNDVWEAYCGGMTFEQFIEPLPDEMFDWVERIWYKMDDVRVKAHWQVENTFNAIAKMKPDTRKDWAFQFQKFPKLCGLLFMRLDNNLQGLDKAVRTYYCKPELEKSWV